MNPVLSKLGKALARYLGKRIRVAGTAAPVPAHLLLASLQPGDVLLVEGNTRVSTAIKYLTQSTWSHAALFVGFEAGSVDPADDTKCFVEADINEGVRLVGMGAYRDLNTRICRPVGLSARDLEAVIRFARRRIGHQYDMRNVFDLARYLLPMPPVPTRFRRRMIALGSGDPTRAICSTLIAQAFQSVHYPILPEIERRWDGTPDCPTCYKEILHIRHFSLFAPRDFDVSPYFQIVKPTLAGGFNYKALNWATDSPDLLPDVAKV